MSAGTWSRKTANDIDTLVYMTELYCAAHHPHAERTVYDGVAAERFGHRRTRPAYLCPSCAQHTEYAEKRRIACIYGDNKSACKLCPTHCYRPEERAFERSVMRYSGPRSFLHRHLIIPALKHGWETLNHFLQEAYEARSC